MTKRKGATTNKGPKKKSKKEPKTEHKKEQRSNRLREQIHTIWSRWRDATEPEVYEYFLSDDGKKDLADLKDNEVYHIWRHFLRNVYTFHYTNAVVVLTSENRRSCIERLIEIVPKKGLGYMLTDSYEPYYTILHLIIDSWRQRSYISAPFPDLICKIIQLTPQKIFSNQLRRRDVTAISNTTTTSDNIKSNGNVLTLLHYAALERAPLWMLKEIYIAYPKAISRQDDKHCGRLPFHNAMQECEHGSYFFKNNEHLERVNFLFSKYPSAAGVIDGYTGQYSLHQLYQIWNSARDTNSDISVKRKNMVKDLAGQFLEICPIAASTELSGKDGVLPLLYVCRREQNHGAFQMIIDLLNYHPHGIFYQSGHTFRGYTPLQLLSSENVCKRLLDKLQLSLENGQHNNSLANKLFEVRDEKNGNTILHALFKMNYNTGTYTRAYGKDPSTNTVLRHGMVSMFSQLTSVRNDQGHLPLHIRLKIGPQKGLLGDVQVLVLQGDVETAAALSNASRNELYPFMMAASRPKKLRPCLSTTFFLLQRFVVLRAGVLNFDNKKN